MENKAAWLKTEAAPQLEVDQSPYNKPGSQQLVIRNRAVAINPIDWVMQMRHFFPQTKYPTILGLDAAGEVVEVGPNSRFAVGDRVLGLGRSIEANSGTFQLYPMLDDTMCVKLPSNLSFEDASVVPLGLVTASSLLYLVLKLELPKVKVQPTGKTVIVWAAGSSVGCNAVQLVKASGYEVIATCSPGNFDHVKSLGADHVLDYKSENLETDLKNLLEGKELGGTADCGSRPAGTHPVCLKVVSAADGSKLVAVCVSNTNPVPENVTVSWINASEFHDSPVAKEVLENYLEEALAAGKYKCAPSPYIVGHGLDAIQQALNVQREGVSCKKVVVTL